MLTSSTLQSSIVFKNHEDFDSNYFRIPFMSVTAKGTLIAGGDIRYKNSSDYNQIDIGIARSEDGGKTWVDKQIVHHRRNLHEHSRKMDGCIIIDKITSRIFLFALALDLHMHLDADNHKMQDLVYKYSDDDGKTWSEEVSLKGFYDDECNLFLQGPGNGIQLQDGTLVIPIQRWVPPHTHIRSTAGIIYSTDHGQTWQQSERRIETYSSESAIVEYKPNEILISCRTPLTDARGFYTTKNLGKTWDIHESNDTIYERGGCQSSMITFTAPNQKTYGLYAAPQHSGINCERSQLMLMVTDNFIHWHPLSDVLYTPNDGYSSLAYDETRHELYILTEQAGNLICYNLTCHLPAIMQCHKTYDYQAISTIHKFPTYSQGHYLHMSHQDEWYKILILMLKPGSFALLELSLLGFNHHHSIILKTKQQSTTIHDTDFCQVISDLPLTLVPTAQAEGYFVYELYYQATTLDTLSLAITNCMLSHLNDATLYITTSFQDPTLESSKKELPLPYNATKLITSTHT